MNELEKRYSEFISTLSHELRTPLTSIRGFADTMLMSGDKLTSEQKEKFLVIIKEQSERLIKLIENVLAVAKLETQESCFIFKQANVLPIIEQTIQIVKTKYPNHFFKICAIKNVPSVYIDTDKFQQIMMNLLENAAKYSEEKTEVIVDVSVCNNDLSVKVKDFGIGIKEEDYEKIFEKFSRLDTPLTRKTQGSGIGLFIVKSLVEKMKGKIILKSSENGSVFDVRLPLSSPDIQVIDKMKENKHV